MEPPASLSPLLLPNGGVLVRNKRGLIIWKDGRTCGDRTTTLVAVERDQVFNDQPVIQAFYTLSRYCCPVVAYFDPTTGARVG